MEAQSFYEEKKKRKRKKKPFLSQMFINQGLPALKKKKKEKR